jgi:hypothetical protein
MAYRVSTGKKCEILIFSVDVLTLWHWNEMSILICRRSEFEWGCIGVYIYVMFGVLSITLHITYVYTGVPYKVFQNS